MHKICADYIRMWERRCYPDGLPDEVPPELMQRVPSYKLIALAILKNDVKLLGIVKPPCRAYTALKRLEISKRPGFEKTQLELF